MKPHRILLFAAVAALLVVAHGCAAEGTSKSEATQAVALTAGTTWLSGLTGIATGGWSIVVGIAAGLVRLLFARSTTTAAPGASGAVTHSGIPVWLLLLVVILWVKRNRVWHMITGGPDGRFKALLRTFGIVTKAPKLS